MAYLRTSWPASFRDATALPPEEVGALVEALIAELDRRDPDCDLEDGDPCSTHVDARGNYLFAKDDASKPAEDDEHDGTEADNGYAEWTSLHGNIRRAGRVDGKVADSWASYVPEDAEDDDPREDDNEDRCLAGDDAVFGGQAVYAALGFGGGDSLHNVGMDEDMEPLAPLTLNEDSANLR